MNEIVKIYNDNPVRIIQRDGEPWFVAADVCKALEISNPSKAVTQLDEDEVSALTFSYTGKSGRQLTNRLNIISESGLYALIIRSNKPEAKKFRKWITAEVLPSIRKTGAYIAPNIGIEQLNAVVQKLVEMSNQLLSDNIVLREKNAYMEQFIPNSIYGEPSRVNGHVRWQMRRGCYVSRNGTILKRMNPDICGYVQPDMFRDYIPAMFLADAVNIVKAKTKKRSPKGQFC